MTTRCFLSTRVAKRTSDGQNLSPYPLAYLLAPQECNNDDTNFWIFTDEGLKRIADRTGWKVVSYITVGETKYSTPADPDHDERAFCLLERKRPTLSAFPNPVPAGNELGKTTVSWDTSDGSIGKVYVSKDGGEEFLFTDSRRGTAVADWIQTGSNYEFRLYDSDHTELLASVVVTKTSR